MMTPADLRAHEIAPMTIIDRPTVDRSVIIICQLVSKSNDGRRPYFHKFCFAVNSRGFVGLFFVEIICIIRWKPRPKFSMANRK